MRNIKYFLYNIRKDLLSTILIIIQMTVITLIITKVGTVMYDNYMVKNQFKNFDFKNMYALQLQSGFYEKNLNSNVAVGDLISFIDDNVIVTSLLSNVNYNNQKLNVLLTCNFDKYNHKYLAEQEVREGARVIVGNDYKDKVEIGQTYSIDFMYSTMTSQQTITLKPVVSGILDEEQYYFNGANGLALTDNVIFIDYHDVYAQLNEDVKLSFLNDVLRASVLQNNTKLTNIEYMNDMENKLKDSGLFYDILPFKESKETVILILKSRYDKVVFQCYIVIIIGIVVLINFMKNIYTKRKKMYAIFILYGYKISDIIIQLIIEIIFILIIDMLLITILFKQEINYQVLIITLFMQLILLIMVVSSIYKRDEYIEKLIK